MFYKKKIEKLERTVNNLTDKILELEYELKSKTTISTLLGGYITWWNDNVLVKDVVKDIVENMGYKIIHKRKEEEDTYIEKKPKIKEVKK